MSGPCRLKDWKDASQALRVMFSDAKKLTDYPVINSDRKSNTVYTDSLRKLKEEIKELKFTSSDLHNTIEKLKEENYELEKRLKEDNAKERTKSKQIKELEHEFNILSLGKLSTESELLKEEAKFKYQVLRNMVGVKCTCFSNREESLLTGFVFNKASKKVIPFSFNVSTMSNDEIRDGIFAYMEETSGKTYKDIPLE